MFPHSFRKWNATFQLILTSETSFNKLNPDVFRSRHAIHGDYEFTVLLMIVGQGKKSEIMTDGNFQQIHSNPQSHLDVYVVPCFAVY